MKVFYLLVIFFVFSSTSGAYETQEYVKIKSRPTKWFREKSKQGPVAVRYYLGASDSRILVEIAEVDGHRIYYWGKWIAPRQVEPVELVEEKKARLLTGQAQHLSAPPSEIFALRAKPYRFEKLAAPNL